MASNADDETVFTQVQGLFRARDNKNDEFWRVRHSDGRYSTPRRKTRKLAGTPGIDDFEDPQEEEGDNQEEEAAEEEGNEEEAAEEEGAEAEGNEDETAEQEAAAEEQVLEGSVAASGDCVDNDAPAGRDSSRFCHLVRRVCTWLFASAAKTKEEKGK